jgi:HSP20 family molecular chaperone IbpA
MIEREIYRWFLGSEKGDNREITMKYNNGILEVRLPSRQVATISGRKIECYT